MMGITDFEKESLIAALDFYRRVEPAPANIVNKSYVKIRDPVLVIRFIYFVVIKPK